MVMWKTRKKRIIIFFVGFCILLGGILSSLSTDTYLGRWFHWRSSDVDDYTRFPSQRVRKSEIPFVFERGNTVNISCIHDRLTTILPTSNTTALLVIKRGNIVYEWYASAMSRESIHTSFSIAKSVISLLISIAIDRGYIASASDPLTMYIPELAEKDVRFKDITIQHLLDMQSGIAYRDHDLPWGDKARSYYDPDIRTLALSVTIDHEPGKKFVYNNYNYILLGIILEQATRMSVPELFEKTLWQEIGTEFDASWSLDSKEQHMAKMESGVNARAVDFAKIGQLILQNGMWQEKQVVSEQRIVTIREISRAYQVYEPEEYLFYQNGWWIQEGTGEKLLSISARGHLGQYIFVYPREQGVVVRFGKNEGNIEWPLLFDSVVRCKT